MTLVERLEQGHRLTEAGCWEWTGYVNSKGYGHITIDGVPRRVHRVAWELFRGPIPQGLQIDHRCRNRRCFCPDHLRLATCRENLLAEGSEAAAARLAAQTHCKRGHLLSGGNLYVRPNGHRECRACRAVHKRRYRQKGRI